MLQAVRCCRPCGVAGGERVPPAPLGWYYIYASGMYSFYRSVQKVIGIKVFILIFLVVFVLETNRQWQFSLGVSL